MSVTVERDGPLAVLTHASPPVNLWDQATMDGFAAALDELEADPPRALLLRLLAIERRQGRRREPGTPRNAARNIDLDLLLYERRRMRSAALTLPHPRMHARAFVLRPLLDVAPHARIPGRGLARRHEPAVRDQRVVRTRGHFLQ